MPVLISLTVVYVVLVMFIISSGSLFSHSNVSEVVLFERIQSEHTEQRHTTIQKFRAGKIFLFFKILRAAFIRSKIQ